MEEIEKIASDYMDGVITIDVFMHKFTICMSELACDPNIVSKAKNACDIAQRILRRTQ